MKDIVGFEGKYAITTCGKVWSYRSNKFIKTRIKSNGYVIVNLCKDTEVGYKRTYHHLHRLVALAYIPNHLNKKTVNHIDGNKLNNCLQNLEWSSHSENCVHSFKLGLSKISDSNKDATRKRLSKAVLQIDIDTGEIVGEYSSTIEAARVTGVSQQQISGCCTNNKRFKSAGNYLWKYTESNININVRGN
jgi:hypothetical protein